MIVYIIRGNTKENEDYKEWDAFCFSSEEKANDMLNILKSLIGDYKNGFKYYYSMEEFEKKLKHIDSNASVFFDGIDYNIIPIEVTE